MKPSNDQLDYNAFEERTKKFYFGRRYDVEDKFPFTIEEFAATLLDMSQKEEPLKEAEEQLPVEVEEEPVANHVVKELQAQIDKLK